MKAKKMMNSVEFKIIRDIKLNAKTVQGEVTNLADKQIVSQFSRKVEVKAKEPNNIIQQWKLAITSVMGSSSNVEKNRFIQMIDLETGQHLPMEMKQI